MKKETIVIEGMHCAACALNIENALKKKKGISQVNVNFAAEKALVEFDPQIISLKEVKSAVQETGYRVIDPQVGLKPGKGQTGQLKKRLVVLLILGLPLIWLVMGPMVGLPALRLPVSLNVLVQLILASGVVLASLELWRSGLMSLVRLRPNMDSLVFLGTAAAFFYSLVVSINFWLVPGGSLPHLYYEGTVFILIFITLGKYLEAATKGKTRLAIKKLINLQPKQAVVIKKGQEIKVAVVEVKVGDLVLVKPGEKVPVDGVVVEGYSGVFRALL